MKDQFCQDCINIWPRFSPATEFMVPGLNVVSLGGQLSKSPCYNPQNPRCQQIWFKFATFLARTSRHIFAGHLPIFVEGFVMFFHMLHIATTAQWAFRGVILSKFMRCCCRGTPGNRWKWWMNWIWSDKTAEFRPYVLLVLLSSFTCWHVIFWLMVPHTN